MFYAYRNINAYTVTIHRLLIDPFYRNRDGNKRALVLHSPQEELACHPGPQAAPCGSAHAEEGADMGRTVYCGLHGEER